MAVNILCDVITDVAGDLQTICCSQTLVKRWL